MDSLLPVPEETLRMHVQEVHQVTLPYAGTAGFTLAFRVEDDSVVAVRETGPASGASTGKMIAGSSVPARYEITALRSGSTRVIFFETRSWSKSPHETVRKVFHIVID